MDFDVFVSYDSRDQARVEALAQSLREADLRVFLDRWYLVPGANWVRALEDTLSRCGAVIVCIGHEMGPWQQREVHAAIERQVAAERSEAPCPVVPVLLAGAEAPTGFLRLNTWVDLRSRSDDPVALAILVKAIRGEAPGPDLQASVQQTLSSICPYRGLQYFREEDSGFFFGREEATRQLVEALEQHSLIALVGASGSGKSSVVRAGLVPALRRSPDATWAIVTLVPTNRPLHSLAAALLPLLEPDMGEVARLGEIGTLAEQFGAARVALRDVVDRALAKQPGTDRLLLVVDQWEELFTLTTDPGTRQRFIEEVLDASTRSQARIVLTLRGDFFGRAITSHRELSDRLQGAQVNLGPMTEDELGRAIEEPARRVGLAFEANLADLIAEHAGDEPGNLPLLEFVLRQLWEQRRGGLLHRGAYDAIGQLEGSVARYADDFVKKLAGSDAAAKQRVQNVFLRLVRPGEGEQDTRCRAAASDFDADATAVIEELVKVRLVVASKDAATDEQTLEIAHEALIGHWKLLRDWVDADRQFRAWQRRLNAAVDDWNRGGRSADGLWRGVALAQAREWGRKRSGDLSEREREFIASGSRHQWLLKIAFGSVASIGIVVFGWLFANSELERQRADQERERGEDLIQFMTTELRNQLAPIGSLALMDGVNAQVDAYYERLGDIGSRDVQWRRSVALHDRGTALRSEGNLNAAQKAYERSLKIRERLAGADLSNANWQRDLSVSYESLGDVNVAAGKLDAARKAYEQGLTVRQRLAGAEPWRADLQNDLSVSYDKLGDVEVASGRLDAARKAYKQNLAIRQRLNHDHLNGRTRRDLSVSYNKLGDIEVAAGKSDDARKAYTESLSIGLAMASDEMSNGDWERLSKSFSALADLERRAGRLDAAREAANQALVVREHLVGAEHAAWQRDRSSHYVKIGDDELAAGKFDAAREAYERGLTIRQHLASADPSSSDLQNDLSLSYQSLGDVNVAAGKLDAARKAYQQSLTITEGLAGADPSNSDWQRDLSVRYDKLGDVEVAAGKLDAARKAYMQSLRVRERLDPSDPSIAFDGFLGDRSASRTYHSLGDVEMAAGRLDAARKAYERSLEIRVRRSLDMLPSMPSTSSERALSASYLGLGNVEVAAGKLDAARKAYERSLEIREPLARADPSNAEWQHDLAESHIKLGLLAQREGNNNAAVEALEKSLAISRRVVAMNPVDIKLQNNAVNDVSWLTERIEELRGNKPR